jgi:biopolymer transport protein ExbD
MLRTAAVLLVSMLFVAAVGAADKAAKSQMVKGTIKSVDASKKVLVVNQKVKDETVERQLDIRDDTEFEVTIGGDTKTATGKDGLLLLEGKEGAEVKVKCDKDVNVLKVTATVKK